MVIHTRDLSLVTVIGCLILKLTRKILACQGVSEDCYLGNRVVNGVCESYGVARDLRRPKLARFT